LKLFLSITDTELVNFYRRQQLDEINYWRQDKRTFSSLGYHEPFCFVSHMVKGQPRKIMGVGFFVEFRRMSPQATWLRFGRKNGFATELEFRQRVLARKGAAGKKPGLDPELGCILLTNPIFFPKQDWIEVPPSMSPRVVAGKTYSTEDEEGAELWTQLEKLIERDLPPVQVEELVAEKQTYQSSYRRNVRLGQESFRSTLLSAYHGTCAVSGCQILPLLEASHIQPWSRRGPQSIRNGLLLRVDLHRLFDAGYWTIAPDHQILVSPSLVQDFPTDPFYHSLSHSTLQFPADPNLRPAPHFLDWHRKHIFRHE